MAFVSRNLFSFVKHPTHVSGDTERTGGVLMI